jgi:hypothetical protein
LEEGVGNALGRDIQPGEQVVINQHIFGIKPVPIRDRVFVCEGGEGLLSDSSGRVITGFFLKSKRKAEMYGYWINKEETKSWQK